MRLLRRDHLAGVRRGANVRIGRGVRLEVAAGAQLHLGDGCRIGDCTRIVVAAGTVAIGRDAVLGERCTIVAHSGVAIAPSAQLGHGVSIVDFDHVFEDVERPVRLQPLSSTPVTIGENARIGLGASILRGITIGAAAIVDPRAVVTRDVPPGAHVGGVPAKPVSAAQ